jgi:hypothetical protein
MRITKLFGVVVLAVVLGAIPAIGFAAERTEGEKYGNNYGYGVPEEDSLEGRTRQELSTHWALARLPRRHQAVDHQRTEGEKFAQNYGFGAVESNPVVASVERTEGDKFANNYGYGPVEPLVASVERTEGDKFANNYGFGTTGELVLDRGQLADASRWQAQANAHLAGEIGVVSTESPAPEPELPWGAIALSGSLMVLLAGATVAIARHQRTAI